MRPLSTRLFKVSIGNLARVLRFCTNRCTFIKKVLKASSEYVEGDGSFPLYDDVILFKYVKI